MLAIACVPEKIIKVKKTLKKVEAADLNLLINMINPAISAAKKTKSQKEKSFNRDGVIGPSWGRNLTAA